MKKIQFMMLLLGSLLCGASYANVNIYTASADASQVPDRTARDRFACNDQVYAVVELDDYVAGDHQLTVRWYSPAGEQREQTRYGFSVLADKERIWAWLKLHRASGTGMMQWLDPSAGMEEFIGNWRISIEIDDVPVGESTFEVLC